MDADAIEEVSKLFNRVLDIIDGYDNPNDRELKLTLMGIKREIVNALNEIFANIEEPLVG